MSEMAEISLREYIEQWRQSHLIGHTTYAQGHAAQHAALQQALERTERAMAEALVQRTESHRREHEQQQIAIDKAETAYDVRFEGLNEARARAIEERNTFATRNQLDDKVSALADRLVAAERTAAAINERLNTIIGMSARINTIEAAQALQSGRDKGIGATWGVLVSVAGFALALGALLHTIIK